MRPLIPMALVGALPVILVLFALLRPRRAVIASYLFTWLFLPMAGYTLPGLPDYTKTTAATGGVLLGVLLFDLNSVLSFRPRWFDFPAVAWCLCPIASSLSNGLGLYDGLSSALAQTITWGLPYFFGRLYFCDADGLRDLAIGIFIGGLIYLPLCAFEIRMSPQLHKLVYGYHQHSFRQTKRFGGFRPMVFMQHGLMVAMWMSAATLAGFWLWRSGGLKHIYGIALPVLLIPLLIVTVLCKSAVALALLMCGVGLLFAIKYTRWKWVLWCFVLTTPIYMGLRISGAWSGSHAVALAAQLVGPERADSLDFRLYNEEMLSDRAMKRPVFGWGGWSRSRVISEKGKDMSTTDSFWIIVLGQRGLFGLAAWTAMMLLPIALLLRRLPIAYWLHARYAPVAFMAVMVGLWMFDNMLNGMINPIYILGIGGLTAFAGLGVVKPAANAMAVPRGARTAVPALRMR